jgi:hypothetical protein
MKDHHDDGGHALRDAQEITSSLSPLVRARDLCFRKMQIAGGRTRLTNLTIGV